MFNEQVGNLQSCFPESKAVATINSSIAQGVSTLAIQQKDCNHLEDDDLQHLDDLD